MATRGIFSIFAIISLWRFRRTNSKSIAYETAHSNFKHLLGFILTFPFLVLVAPRDDEKCLANGVARHVPILTIITLWRFWYEFAMPLTQKRGNEISRNFQDSWQSWWSWLCWRPQKEEVPLAQDAARAVFLHYKPMETRHIANTNKQVAYTFAW